MIWYELSLPVYKQGDDLAHAINKHVDELAAAFREQAAAYEWASGVMSVIANHPRVAELQIAAMAHSITVDGPEDLLVELCERKLIQRFEDNSDEEDQAR